MPVTATSFRKEGEPVATVFGGVDEVGNRILQTGRDGNYMRVGTARLRIGQALAVTNMGEAGLRDLRRDSGVSAVHDRALERNP